MKHFANFYYIYSSVPLKLLRLFLYIFLGVPAFYGLISGIYPNFFIIPISLFLMFEVYFFQKISKLMPAFEIEKNTGDVFDSFSLEALSIYDSSGSSKSMVKKLLNLPQVQFMIYKFDANIKDVPINDIDKNSVAKNAFDIAKKLGGKHVTTMDLFVSYLLLIEPATQFLFGRRLKTEDTENILIWASNTYVREESSKSSRVNFAGEGIAEDWVYGWTNETQKYMVDLTGDFLKTNKEPIGRQNEYKQMVEALFKGGSVILVGDSGSGKESLVKQLAIESFMGTLKGSLYHQKIFQLMVDAFLAGAAQGELEQRFTDMMQELTHSGNVIVYIPEFQNIMGSESFHLDISGAITPYLTGGKLKIIAAVTPGAFKRFIEPMHALLDSFTVIDFSKATHEETLNMLFAKTIEIEHAHHVSLSYKAVLACVNYGENYSKEKVMPGAAVTLMEDTANSVHLAKRKIVEEADVMAQIKKVVHVDLGEPQKEEKDLLLNLEIEVHKRVIGQDTAVSAISEALRRLRSGLTIGTKPISFLFLGPTGVGKTETAKALAEVYFGNSSRLIRLDMSEYVGEEGVTKLLGSAPGKGEEKGVLTEAVFDSPYSLILLDEFEKADQKILDLFLQVFEDGRLTDSKGKTVSFVNTIIIATSNAASEFIRENNANNSANNKKFKQTLMEFLQTKGIFKPELLNRFDDIVVFNPLEKAQLDQIVKIMLTAFSKSLYEKDIKISFDPKVLEKVETEGYDKDFGARPLRRYIQDNIEDLIARKMLKDEIKRGDSVLVGVDSSGNIEITK